MASYLTSADVASRLGVSVRTVTRASLRHGIGVKVGRIRVYTIDDISWPIRGFKHPGPYSSRNTRKSAYLSLDIQEYWDCEFR